MDERPCDHFVASTAGVSSPPKGATLHASLYEARDAVREQLAAITAGRNGNRLTPLPTADAIVVCLGRGTHALSGPPLSLGAADAAGPGRGLPRVVWRGSPGNGSVVTGGVGVTGWRATTLGGSDVLVADVPAAAVASGPAGVIRTLWVNGTRASRTALGTTPDPSNVNASSKCTCDEGGACAPSQRCTAKFPHCVGFVPNKQWGKCEASAAGGVPAMKAWVQGSSVGFAAVNPNDPVVAAWAANSTTSVEFLWPIVIRNWIEPRCTVASVVGGNITLASPCGAHLVARHVGAPPTPVVVEASAHFPLPPGTFYHDHDGNRLFYSPLPGQTLADVEADAAVATKEVLVTMDSTTGHTWVSVAFSHATWHQANSPDGFVDAQTAVYACTAGTPGCNLGTTGEPLGAVRVSGCQDVAVRNCSFAHLGSPYALSVWGGSQRVEISGSTFTDLSGGFVKLGSVDSNDFGGSPDPDRWDAFITVRDNVASGQAVEYGGAAGFFGGFLFSADVSHNTVSEAGYSGFSLGWGWGTVYPPGFGNNTISYNRIFDVMTKMKDGGGIYINGATNGSHPSTVHHNWVTRDEHVYAVYYFDNGASHWRCTNNVATNSSVAWAYFMTGGPGAPDLAAHNVSIDHFWYSGDANPVNNCKKYGCVEDTATIFKIAPTEPMPPAALAIEQGAGARVAVGSA